MITEIEDYFSKGCGRCDRFDTPDCSTKRWAEGLAALRRICLDAGLSEHVKWGHPCYMHAGRNITLFGAFRDDFRMTFFKARLLKDPEGILERPGPNSQTKETVRFTSNGDPEAQEKVLRAYIAESMDYAERGIVPEKIERTVPMPDELIEALDEDPELAEAFNNLTPGRQKSYAINLNSAKKPETRVARIAKFRDKIIAGKGALEY